MAAITPLRRASGFEPFELPVDSVAAARLYESHAGRVFGFCLSRLGRREDAEDAVQTTFLEAVRSLRRGVVPLVESAWLIGIARNVCRARWEAAGRERRLESVCDPAELGRETAAPQGRRDELIGLDEALRRLPEQQRRAVLLRDWRGLSYEEVAEELGVSHAAVETLIFRGRRALAEHLREEPKRTRRRLASLGNLGSIFTAVKSALTGAAAVSVAAVAVGGAGVAISSSPPAASEAPSVPAKATSAPAVARPQIRTARPQAIVVSPHPARTRVAPGKQSRATQRTAPVQAVVSGSRAANPSAATPAPAAPPPPAASAPKPAAATSVKPIVSAPPVPKEEVPPVTGGAEQVVEATEPLTAPVADAVPDVTQPLPPVTVTLPAPVPLPPVSVTPPVTPPVPVPLP